MEPTAGTTPLSDNIPIEVPTRGDGGGDRDPGSMSTALRYIVDAYDDEPLFVIRGRDLFALSAIEAYAEQLPDSPALSEARNRVAMLRYVAMVWQRDNPHLVKIPD